MISFLKLPCFALAAMVFLAAGSLRAQSERDLVEIQSVDPTIQVELKYATAYNITGKVLYPPEFRARLRRGVMEDLRKAQETLRPLGYGLKVWDAYRPLDAQRALHAINSDPRYVSEPGAHSMHNRGVAVDVTLVDTSGKEVAMPTAFDVMGPAASYFYKGTNSVVEKNLRLLQRVMKQSGFYACRTEWWHFFSRRWEDFPNVPEKNETQSANQKNKSKPAAVTFISSEQ